MVPYPPTYRIRRERPDSGWVQQPPAPRGGSLGETLAVFLSVLAVAFGAAFAVRGLTTKRPPPAPVTPAVQPPRVVEDDVAKLDALLTSVEANLARFPRTRALCPAVDKNVTVASVLAGDRDDASYMTSPDVRTALDKKAAHEARAKAAHEAMSTPYIAVVASHTKDVVKKRGSWSASFDGWLYLVDTKSGQPVCAAPLAFESSAKVHKKEDAALRTLRDDLEARFRRESATALGSIAGKNLTLAR